ncbi:MAG: T9SS type A sorting domain-containing protein [Bacteroidetes bacterium]|nr:T9SS type A sorting domain-containing protein [Bacteroidota bacterium]
MKKNILLRNLLMAMLFVITVTNVQAQCGAGYTRDTLNWDYLDFLQSTGSYSPSVTLAQVQNQRFTFGTQTVTITNSGYAAASILGDDNSFTAKTGSYGNGADLRFKSNGTITFKFQNAVQNLKFSIYDIDKNQRVDVSALNGATGTNVTLSTLAGSILTLGTNNTPSASATANSTLVAFTDNAPSANGTVNVDITGPVTSFTITTSSTGTSGGSPGEDGSFFISDISACSAGTFPTGYYQIAKPFTGQPAYFLAVRDNYIYYVNVNNGVARLLFRDNTNSNINSLAYDPYRHMVYYSFSLTGSPSTDKRIRRYDYDMDTLGDFISNVNTLGIPTFEAGVESGAAAFYNGCYYLGIEGTNMGDDKSGRESIIWRIDLNAGYGPASIAQAYGIPSDDGNGNGLHDWGDIGINDGILYDFDGAAGETDFYHKNLLTGSVEHYNPSPSSLVPRQVSVDWTGQMYNSGSPSSSSSGTVTPYNGNGTVDNTRQYTMRYQGVAVTGSWGDAGEAFKPKTDFGDAPATYDPPAFDPGTHEKNDSIYLGALKPGLEWLKKTSSDATGDGVEEDGVSGLQVITTGVSNFTVPVKVMNRTGRNATVVGWVDANGNGTFEAGEGTSVTVPSSGTAQNISLLWSNINTTLPAYATTFMRIRIATADQGMTTASMNGYFDNGEIEDYVIAVGLLLPDQNITLKAQKINSSKVSLVWNLNQENNNTAYELQRSEEGVNWETITSRQTNGSANPATYTYTDTDPLLPASYYKVKIMKSSGNVEYSDVKKVDFSSESAISLSPNPAKNRAVLKIDAAMAGMGQVNILDYNGRKVYDSKVKLAKGSNEIDLPFIKNLSSGMYKVRVKINDEIFVTTLVVMK